MYHSPALCWCVCCNFTGILRRISYCWHSLNVFQWFTSQVSFHDTSGRWNRGTGDPDETTEMRPSLARQQQSVLL